ncbi:MAG: MaoC family dehydratase N-terminal domain-containing protein [Pseudomonadota bacterium]
MDQINLNAWIDRSDTATGLVAEQQARLIHAVLGAADSKPPRSGDPMPHLWHWYAFPQNNSMAELGEDGHPKLGSFLPPLRLNRRMWAGGKLTFIAPLYVGEALSRRTVITDIKQTAGSAGEMVIIRLDHEIHGAQGLALVERQDIVYLQIPERYHPPKKTACPEAPDLHRSVRVSTPLLFRYSAITFNAHRIHYDLPYTQEVEHYPDLVVHGPLQAQLLMDLATEVRGAAPKTFAYRGVHPLFAQDALSLCAVKSSSTVWAMTANANGQHQTMQANVEWEI